MIFIFFACFFSSLDPGTIRMISSLHLYHHGSFLTLFFSSSHPFPLSSSRTPSFYLPSLISHSPGPPKSASTLLTEDQTSPSPLVSWHFFQSFSLGDCTALWPGGHHWQPGGQQREERRGRPNLEQRWGRNSGVIEDNVRSWAAVTSSSTSRISPGESSVPEGWRDNSSPRLEECISPCLPFSAPWGVLEWQTWAGQSLAPLQGSLCQSQTEWFIFISNIHYCYYTFIWKYFLSFPSQ